jgi:lipopolysaccharide export system protein LptA
MSRSLLSAGLIAGSALLGLLALQPALGQGGAGSSLKGHDTDAPVDVAADRIEVQDRADRAIFSGNVEVRQGNLNLAASRLTVAYANADGIEITRLEASGGVTLRSPSETARSQFAIYDLNRRLVTMLGGVTLNRGESRVQGGRLVIDLDSGRAVMDGGAAGSRSAGGRVTGRFTVPQRGNN